MVDKNIIAKIVKCADLKSDDIVIEIGCGSGLLTKEIAKSAKYVIAFEIDKDIIADAKEYLIDMNNIEIFNHDFLKYDLKEIIDTYNPAKPIKIIANLPYYITSPIIEKIILFNADNSNKIFSKGVITVQKEFAKRITGKPGTKDYGSFSIFVNYYAAPKIISFVSRNSFFPKPKVDSAVVLIDFLSRPNYLINDKAIFFKIVKAAFNQRRKILKNSLLLKFNKAEIDNALKKSNIDPKRRGETLSIEEFALAANNFALARQPNC